MPNALGDDTPLTRTEGDHATWRDAVRLRLQIDQERAVENEEELVVIGVLMPVIFPLHDSEANNGLVHANERLIVPRIPNRGDEWIERDLLQRIEEDVQIRGVREL